MTPIHRDTIKVYLDSQTSLMTLRRQYVNRLLSISSENLEQLFIETLRGPYQQLLDLDLRWLTMSAADLDLGRSLLSQWDQGFAQVNGVQIFLSVSLFYPPHLLRCSFDLENCPKWFLETYLDVLFTMPKMFTWQGEVDAYYRYLFALLELIDRHYLSDHAQARWVKIGSYCAQKINMIPVLFTTYNLKAIQEMRARIIEKTFVWCDKELSYTFRSQCNSTKIRLGFLTNHLTPSTETFASIPLFSHLNPDIFEVTIYVKIIVGHPLEDYCRSGMCNFVRLPQDLDQSVQRIRQDDLDILLIGTNISMVFNDMVYLGVHRLARIQIPHPGSVTTTGFRHCDLFISSDLCERTDDAQQFYSETLVLQNGPTGTYAQQVEALGAAQKTLKRTSFGIPSESVRFISGANCMKIIPELLETWVKIIKDVPGSTLILYPFGPAWYPSYPHMLFVTKLDEYLHQHQLDAYQLIVLGPVSTRAEIFEYLKLGDIYLDSFPFSGGTSIYDPILAGLPVVTKQGETFRHNMAASTLWGMGLNDLVTETEEEYCQTALKLALDESYRKEKQKAISHAIQKIPPFFDTANFSKKFNECLLTISDKLPTTTRQGPIQCAQ